MDVHVWVSVAAALLVTSALAGGAGGGGAGGWLGRLVLHHKNHFIDDIKQLAPIKIQASIEPAPAGYVDPPGWDYASVLRLLALIGASETARPVRSALRRALTRANETAIPSRRFMSRQKSYKYYPSLVQTHMSNMYYDEDTDAADYDEEELPPSAPGASPALPSSAVVRVTNPLEARLPSGQISINLLKDILEARALAARKMPPTKPTPGWTWTTSKPTTTKKATALSTTHVTAKDAGNAATKATAPADDTEPATTATAITTTATAITTTSEDPSQSTSPTLDTASDIITTDSTATDGGHPSPQRRPTTDSII